MKYPQIMARVFREPWLITPEKHEVIQRVLLARISGDSAAMMDEGEDEDDGRAEVQAFGKTYVIPVYGILGKHLSGLEMMCGGCSVDEICDNIEIANRDQNIETVVFDIRSPGGTVTGIPECGDMIASMEKRTIAFTDSECCSGALWLASQCDEFFATKSAHVGSVGVYRYYEDHSREMELAGVRPEPVSAGKFKLMGAYFKPLTDEERQMAQAQVNRIYDDFKGAVTAKRKVSDECMQGQVFYGDEAANAGFCAMVDSFYALMDGLEG